MREGGETDPQALTTLGQGREPAVRVDASAEGGSVGVHVGAWGITAGIATGITTAVVTSDRLVDAGPSTGALFPASMGGSALGLVALSAASRSGWRWGGSPATLAAARAAGPLAVGAVGGAIGLGAALLTNRIWPGSGESDEDAERTRATASSRLDAEQRQFDAQLAQLDAALEPHDGRMGAPGTVGEGRLDVTGLSPEQAANAVFEAYAPGRPHLEPGIVRVDGANVFSLPWVDEDYLFTPEHVTDRFEEVVDVAEPKGIISADEARRWQTGPMGEVRSSGDDDAATGAGGDR